MSNYAIVIQARTSSTRLPKKVLMDLEGMPMLLRQVDRLTHFIPDIPLIVNTSNDSSDDPIESLCNEHGINCYRGPLDDVMLRFIKCADEFDIDFIIRVGGDDPLVDPECCKTLISIHKDENQDFLYASNREGWPYGTAAELISTKILKEIHTKTEDPLYREHIIPYFFDNPDEFVTGKVIAPIEIRRPDYFFTVDFLEDLELIRSIFRSLNKPRNYFTFKQVINLVDRNPDILKINSHLHEGFDH